MQNLLILFTLLLFLFSCQNISTTTDENTITQETQRDTIAFFEEFKEKKHCIHLNEDTLCALGSALILRIEQGPNKAAADKIRTQLRQEVSGDSMSVSEYLDNFILGVDYYLEEKYEYWPSYFAIDVIQDLALNNKFLMTGTTHQHSDEGGAHGSYYSQYFNFDINTGENLDWHKLVTDTLQIYKLAEKTLQMDVQEQEEGIEVNLYEFYDFPDDKFYLPTNFLIEEQGLSFLYTVYEIGPYVQGETEITLPFEKVKSLVKKGTVLSDFLETIDLSN